METMVAIASILMAVGWSVWGGFIAAVITDSDRPSMFLSLAWTAATAATIGSGFLAGAILQ